MTRSTLFACFLVFVVCSVTPAFSSDDIDDDNVYSQTATAVTSSNYAPASTPSDSAATYVTGAYYAPPAAGAVVKLVFHGYYAGACSQDGFYVNGPYSLVVCSNGRAHVQPCAPGTRNAAVRTYVPGVAYQHTDFCSENLNDYAGTARAVITAGVPYYSVYPYGAYHAGYPFVY